VGVFNQINFYFFRKADQFCFTVEGANGESPVFRDLIKLFKRFSGLTIQSSVLVLIYNRTVWNTKPLS